MDNLKTLRITVVLSILIGLLLLLIPDLFSLLDDSLYNHVGAKLGYKFLLKLLMLLLLSLVIAIYYYRSIKYIDNQEKTMMLNILDPGLYRLIDAGILNSKPSFLGIPTDFDINIDAWIFLNKNPQYLEIEESN